MREARDTRNWPIGTQQVLPAEQLQPEVLRFVRNGAFMPTPGGTVALVRRPGLTAFRQSTETNTLVNMLTIQNAGGPSFIMALSSGTVKRLTSGTETNLTISASVTVTQARQQAVTVGDVTYVVGVNGGSTAYNWLVDTGNTIVPYGINTPGNAPTTASAGAGAPNGTYNFKVVWYDSTRGTESSPSSAGSYTTSGSEDITVNRNNTTPPDGVDMWRLYVQKDGLQGNYYLHTTTATATTTFTFNSSDAALTALTTRGPDANANDPPPALRCHAWHLNRMFGGADQTLYWSNVDAPRNWDPANAITVGRTDEGGVTALWSLGVDRMLVFKHGAIYLLAGDSSQNWVLGRIFDHWGTRSALAVAEGGGMVGFISTQGPAVMSTSLNQAPELLNWSGPLGEYVIRGQDEDQWGWWTVYDPEGNRFLFQLHPGLGSPTRWTVAAWSVTHKAWEGLWDIPGQSLGSPSYVQSATAAPARGTGSTALPGRTYFGLGAGMVAFLEHKTQTDLAANTTGSALAYDVESATSATFTISDAGTFPIRTTLDSRVTVIDGTYGYVEQREYTSSGTTTKTITLGSALSFTPSTNSVAVFDMPVLEVESGVFGANDHTRKRALLGYVGVNTDGDMTVQTFVMKDGAETASRGFRHVVRRNSPTEFFSNPSDLDVDSVPMVRQRIGLVGQWFRWKVVLWSPISRWALTRMAMKIAKWGR